MSVLSSEVEALREPAEVLFRHEIAALQAADTHERPHGWLLSPRAVLTYVMGGSVGETSITAKYLGNVRKVEIAIATLATDRALLLLGEPGTAKSWLSEHLSAAITGHSQMLVQGTAGTSEESVRYGWNYALLIAEGPSQRALVPSPVMRAMQDGGLVRFEEITRCSSEVQDTLIPLLSEKVLAIPELNTHVKARRGFNMIATANTRDRGVNEMSAALKRRFNIVVLPVPTDLEEEVSIVEKRVREMGHALKLSAALPSTEAVRRVVQVFQELRRGQTLDGKQKLKSPSGVLSTAEAIGVLAQGLSMASHFGNGVVSERDLAASLIGAVVRDEARDANVWIEYLETVMRARGDVWRELYTACKEIV